MIPQAPHWLVGDSVDLFALSGRTIPVDFQLHLISVAYLATRESFSLPVFAILPWRPSSGSSVHREWQCPKEEYPVPRYELP